MICKRARPSHVLSAEIKDSDGILEIPNTLFYWTRPRGSIVFNTIVSSAALLYNLIRRCKNVLCRRGFQASPTIAQILGCAWS